MLKNRVTNLNYSYIFYLFFTHPNKLDPSIFFLLISFPPISFLIQIINQVHQANYRMEWSLDII